MSDLFFILTTADCLSMPNGTPLDIHQMKIGIGVSSTNFSSATPPTPTTGQILNVQTVFVPEDGAIGSLALFQTVEKIQLSDNVQPVCLPSWNAFSSGHVSGEVAAFGSLNTATTIEKEKNANLPFLRLLSLNDCSSGTTYGLSLPPKLCVRIKDGNLACRGGAGYAFVSKDAERMRYTVHAVMSSAITNYTCTGFTKIEPVLQSMEWIRLQASRLARSGDNFLEEQERDDRHKSGKSSSETVTIIVSIAIGIAIVISVIVVLSYFRSRMNKEKMLTKDEMDAFFKGNKTPTSIPPTTSETGYECIPYDNSYEVIDSDFFIDVTHILGSGTYGIVHKGTFQDTPVAIKTVKPGAEKSYLMSLLSELKVMIHLGNHPNLVSLLGAHTKFLKNGILFVIVELCDLGSLSGYLTKYQNFKEETSDNLETEISQNSYQNVPNLSKSQLLKWALEISLALEYLGEKKVIHGDLAARNVLLTASLQAKVSDFGLSRKLYEYTTYVKTHQEPLPWRWMALESLQKMEFSTKSDVWSFGITVWEIFTLGDVPYPGMSYTVDFPIKLCEGLRLYAPPQASEEIFDLMKRCWRKNPDARPSFTEIKAQIHELILSNSTPGEEYTNVEDFKQSYQMR